MLGSLFTLPLRISLRAAELSLRGAASALDRAAEFAAAGKRTMAPRQPPAARREAEVDAAAAVDQPLPSSASSASPPSPPSAPPPSPPSPPSASAPPPPPPSPPPPPTPPPASVEEPHAPAADAVMAQPPSPVAAAADSPRPASGAVQPVAPIDAAEVIDYDAPEPVEPVHVSEDAELVEESAEPGAAEGAGAQVRVSEPWEGYGELRAKDVVDRLGAASTAELAAIELYEMAGRGRKTVIAAAQRELARRG
ncbi:MAG: hypothetical protein JOZ07_19075 [Solirubrobacterales bacterium]|nr:hypothetical protein [Solirubrobacterales bacterium]